MSDEDAVWRALSQPRRREILRLVADGERTATEIADSFDITRPAVSQHLSALKDAGLLAERRVGTKRFYRARPEQLRAVTSWLQKLGVVAKERPRVAEAATERRPAARPARPVTRVEHHELDVDLRAAALWRLFAVPEMRARWKGGPEPEVLELSPGRSISWRWRWRPAEPAATVRVQLEAEGRATRVRLTHDGPGGDVWPRYLDRLLAVSRGWDPGPEEEE